MAESSTPKPPDEGPLETTSVPHLLALAWRDRRTGCLRLAHGKRELEIRVDQGAPVAIESTGDEDRFAQALEEAGRIDAAGRLKVERMASERECPQASAVLALKLLDAKALYTAMRQHTRNRIGETFEWAAGMYRWENVPTDAPAPGKPHDILSLIQSQLPRRWGTDRLFGDLMQASEVHGEIAPRYRRVARKLASSGDLAAKAIGRLDGSVPLGTVLGECVGDPLAAATLWTLLHAGILRVGEGGAREAAAVPLEFEVEIDGQERETTEATIDAGKQTGRGAASSKKAEALGEEISTLLGQLSDLDHYAALGLDAKAGPAEIKKAYFKAAKKYHPDALARLGLDELRDDAAIVFARIAEAFETLSDSEKKAAYDEGGSDEPEIDMARLAQAETSFRKGEILLKMGNFGGALDYLQPAVELWPDEPAYQTGLGWALYKQPQRDVERAREHLEIAARQAPEDATVLYRLGVVLRAAGEPAEGDELIARARALDPTVEE